MLSEIIGQAIASEPDMTIIDSAYLAADDLGTFSRTKRIDVIIFPADAAYFSDDRIDRLLNSNPRLGLLAVNGQEDSGELHHLVPVSDDIGPLTVSTVIAAIRAGSALRRR